MAGRNVVLPSFDITPSDAVIAVMGMTGAGKSTFISHFSDIKPAVNRGLESCTNTVDVFRCWDQDIGEFYLVDTPGFDDTNISDTGILMEVSAWMTKAHRENIPLTGIIYLHKITDNRLGGTALRNLRMFQKLCGEQSLSKVVLATTFWRKVTSEIDGKRREDELKNTPNFWGKMITFGARPYRQDKDRASAKRIIEYLIRQRPAGTPGMNLKIVDEIENQGKTLDQTAAGKEVNVQISKLREEYEEKLRNLRHDLKEAIAKNNKSWQAEIRKERQEHDDNIKKLDEDRKKLQADHDQLRNKVDGSYASYTREYDQRDEVLEGLREERRLMHQQNADAAEKDKLRDEIRTANLNLELLKWKIRQAQSCAIM